MVDNIDKIACYWCKEELRHLCYDPRDKEDLDRAMKDIWAAIENLNHATLRTLSEDTLIYRQINISKTKDDMQVFDNTTSVYRPLSAEEIIEMARKGPEQYCKELKLKSLKKKLAQERNRFHIESIKRNRDKADRHYKKAIKLIHKLRNI
jgi:hypothetical protein